MKPRKNHPTVMEMRENPQLAEIGQRRLAMLERNGEVDLCQSAFSLIEMIQRIRFLRQSWVQTTPGGTHQVCWDSKSDNGEVAYQLALHRFNQEFDKSRLVDNARAAIKRNLMCWR